MSNSGGPKYPNGTYTLEDVIERLEDIGEQIGMNTNLLTHLKIDLAETNRQTAQNTGKIAEVLEGMRGERLTLIEKATDSWKVPMPAFLVVIAAMGLWFLLDKLEATGRNIHATGGGVEIHTEGEGHAKP